MDVRGCDGPANLTNFETLLVPTKTPLSTVAHILTLWCDVTISIMVCTLTSDLL